MLGWYLLGLGLAAAVIYCVVRRVRHRTAQIPNDAKLDKFRNDLWLRGTGQPYPQDCANKTSDAERAMAYVDRAIDRQINKARGILPFDSLIIAVMSIEKTRMTYGLTWHDPLHDWLIFYMYAVIVGLAYASYLCLELFNAHWGDMEVYEKFSRELDATIKTVRNRSYTLERSIVISIAGLFVGIGVIAAAEIAPSFQKSPPAQPPGPQLQTATEMGLQVDLATHGMALDCGDGSQQIVTFKDEGQTNFDGDKNAGGRQLERVLAALQDRAHGRRLFGLVLFGSADRVALTPVLKSTYADNGGISKKRVEWVSANLSAKLLTLNPLGFNPPEIISVNSQLSTVRLVSPSNNAELIKAVAVCSLWG